MCRQRDRPAPLLVFQVPCSGETILPACEVIRKRAGHSLSPLLEGISNMIALKITALVLGAGMLFELFSGSFGPDLILAVVACLS
jgi:hypothetical protein